MTISRGKTRVASAAPTVAENGLFIKSAENIPYIEHASGLISCYNSLPADAQARLDQACSGLSSRSMCSLLQKGYACGIVAAVSLSVAGALLFSVNAALGKKGAFDSLGTLSGILFFVGTLSTALICITLRREQASKTSMLRILDNMMMEDVIRDYVPAQSIEEAIPMHDIQSANVQAIAAVGPELEVEGISQLLSGSLLTINMPENRY